MSENMGNRRTGGREGRRAVRLSHQVERLPFLTRSLAPFEVLGEEGLSLIERNADTILQEVGIEFRGDQEALRLLRDAGADVEGERVRFPRGMCRQIVQATAPRQFTQYARNEANNVEIGGTHTVFAPNYGSPFVRDLDRGRRYGTIEDFRNFVKLAYMSPHLHHSGGTVCEPVDVPVNKRHLDMVYSHIRYSDKPFMGSSRRPSGPATPSRWRGSRSARTTSRTTASSSASSTRTRRSSGTRRCSARPAPTPRRTRRRS